MSAYRSTQPLTCALIAPLIALTPAWNANQARPLSPQDAAALQALSVPDLGSLRAGRVEAPASFSAAERAELEAAQQSSPALADLRAGRGINNDALPWVILGAALVVLILVL